MEYVFFAFVAYSSCNPQMFKKYVLDLIIITLQIYPIFEIMDLDHNVHLPPSVWFSTFSSPITFILSSFFICSVCWDQIIESGHAAPSMLILSLVICFRVSRGIMVILLPHVMRMMTHQETGSKWNLKNSTGGKILKFYIHTTLFFQHIFVF